VLNFTEAAHAKSMSAFEQDEPLQILTALGEVKCLMPASQQV
jgi:hypothetical protein